MLYTGILVLVRREAWDETLAVLEGLEEVEVHHREPGTGRVVVVVETDEPTGQEQALRRIRAVPGIVVAEPVYHYRPEDADEGSASGTGDAAADQREDES